MDTSAVTLALDIGGTKTAAALVTGTGEVVGRVRRPTPAGEGGAAVLAAAIELARQVAATGPRPRAVGIGAAGVIDEAGRVSSATDSLPGWTGTRVAESFARAFGVPAHALNDVHAHGIGEARYGAGAGHRSVLLVAAGTGIGGCLTIDGHPLLGAHGLAGHVGHLAVPEADDVPCPCGRTGHLEGLASGTGILARFRAQGGSAESGADVARIAADHADRQTKLAARVLDTCGHALGRVVGGLLNVLDPDVVVLGGSVAEAGPDWHTAVRRGIAHDAMDAVAQTPLLAPAAGADAALLGAAAHALDKEERP